jgi:hypothetical protein
MTEAVFREMKSGEITAVFEDLLMSDRSCKRTGTPDWKLKWSNGRLTDLNARRDIPVFHFVDMKNAPGISSFDLSEKTDSFTIGSNGFQA